MSVKGLSILFAAATLCLGAGVAAMGQVPPPPKGPFARPTLLANVESIAPGKPFDVAIAFELDEEYHLYWINPGQSGRQPFVNWDMPAGFSAGPLRFPPPQRHVAPGNITTFILEGSPILLATITPPESIAADPVTITARVDWLVCKDACFLEDKTLKLELPVVAAGAAPKPANVDVFKRAERAMPLARSQRGVKIAPAVEGFAPEKGDTFDLLLNVTVPRGLHIQSNKPTEEFYIAADTFLERTDGIQFGEPQYPEPHIRDAKFLGKVSEFEGAITIRIPSTVESADLPSSLRLAGVFRMQACTDGGQCYPPESVAFESMVPVKSADAGAASGQAARGDENAAPVENDEDAETQTAAVPVESATTPPSSEPGPAGGAESSTAARSLAPPAPPPGNVAGAETRGIAIFILLGFLGGLILNVMPCVLPVISIKVLSFVQQAGEDRGRVLRLGLAFCAGIIVWFWGFAAITLVGLDQPLQNPWVVVGLTAVMFVFGLSLFGVFEINLPGRASTTLAGAAEREGYTGAFLKGLLATVLGTACTAPLLAPALAWAATQPPVNAFIVFSAAGLGMAAPYLVLSAAPGWMRYLPRPGNWMITFKQAMGFLLIGTAVWLLWVLSKQWYEDGVVWTVGFLAFLGVSCWLVGKVDINWHASSQYATWAAAIVIAIGGWTFCYRYMFNPAAAIAARKAMMSPALADVDHLNWENGIPWQAYQPGKAEELARRGYTVYVDYTAAWCWSCQTNKKAVLETDAIRRRMADLGVIPIKADFTNPDPDIEEDLRRFQRSTVPLNIIVPACAPESIQVLPVLLTQNTVSTALDAAGPSHGDACS